MGNEHEPMTTELVTEPVSAIEAQSRAEYDVQIATAQRYPKHSTPQQIARFQSDSTALATIDEETAESCLYSTVRKPMHRGGKQLKTGPSIRLAEIVASRYGNLRFGYRVTEVGATSVTVQGIAHDLEANVSGSSEVRRRILTREGKRYSEDMIIITCNAAGSIAIRNAIFKVVPAALIRPVFEAAINRAMGGEATIQERRAKALAKFAAMGIEQARVLKAVGRHALDDVTFEDLVALVGIYSSIKGGELSPEDAFPEEKKPEVAVPPKVPEKKPPKPPKPAEPKQAPEPEAKPEQAVADTRDTFNALWPAAKRKQWSMEQLGEALESNGPDVTALELGVDLEPEG